MPIKIYTSLFDYLFTANIHSNYIPMLSLQDKVIFMHHETGEPCMYWNNYKKFVDIALEIDPK
jgi:hypothetical protein